MLPDYLPALAQFVTKAGQHFGERNHRANHAFALRVELARGRAAVNANAEDYRRHADECYRLSVQVQNPEHKSLALYLAAAWLELAQQAERKQAARDVTIPPITTPPPPDSLPKDQIE